MDSPPQRRRLSPCNPTLKKGEREVAFFLPSHGCSPSPSVRIRPKRSTRKGEKGKQHHQTGKGGGGRKEGRARAEKGEGRKGVMLSKRTRARKKELEEQGGRSSWRRRRRRRTQVRSVHGEESGKINEYTVVFNEFVEFVFKFPPPRLEGDLCFNIESDFHRRRPAVCSDLSGSGFSDRIGCKNSALPLHSLSQMLFTHFEICSGEEERWASPPGVKINFAAPTFLSL